MHITGPSGTTYTPGMLPPQIAKAYGLKPQAVAIRSSTAASVPQPIAKPDTYHSTHNARSLVAATVSKPVDFDGVPAPRRAATAAPTNVLQLYTRAADRVEAAVAIQLGRSIDVQG